MTVYEFEKIIRKWKIFEKKPDGNKGKFLRDHQYEVNGLSGDKIWVKKNLSDEDAAATLYHEAFHTTQRKDTEIMDREIEAWLKEQEFRLKHKIPVDPDWLSKDGSLKVETIKKDVRAMYAHRDPDSKEFYEFAGQDETGKKEIRNWKCEKINEKP